MLYLLTYYRYLYIYVIYIFAKEKSCIIVPDFRTYCSLRGQNFSSQNLCQVAYKSLQEARGFQALGDQTYSAGLCGHLHSMHKPTQAYI